MSNFTHISAFFFENCVRCKPERLRVDEDPAEPVRVAAVQRNAMRKLRSTFSGGADGSLQCSLGLALPAESTRKGCVEASAEPQVVLQGDGLDPVRGNGIGGKRQASQLV